MLILALSIHLWKNSKKNFGSGVHKVIERHLHMKPEGQEYHKKEKKRDSEKGKCMEKALYWLRDIYTVKVRTFRLKLFSRLNGFKDECV